MLRERYKGCKLKEYILGGLDNENVISMDEEINEETGHTIEELMIDRESSAEKTYFRLLRWESMVKAFANLTPRQKYIVASRCGICEHCFGTTEILEFQDFATNNGLISAEAVEKAYKKATAKMHEYVRRNYG